MPCHKSIVSYFPKFESVQCERDQRESSTLFPVRISWQVCQWSTHRFTMTTLSYSISIWWQCAILPVLFLSRKYPRVATEASHNCTHTGSKTEITNIIGVFLDFVPSDFDEVWNQRVSIVSKLKYNSRFVVYPRFVVQEICFHWQFNR